MWDCLHLVKQTSSSSSSAYPAILFSLYLSISLSLSLTRSHKTLHARDYKLLLFKCGTPVNSKTLSWSTRIVKGSDRDLKLNGDEVERWNIFNPCLNFNLFFFYMCYYSIFFFLLLKGYVISNIVAFEINFVERLVCIFV